MGLPYRRVFITQPIATYSEVHSEKTTTTRNSENYTIRPWTSNSLRYAMHSILRHTGFFAPLHYYTRKSRLLNYFFTFMNFSIPKYLFLPFPYSFLLISTHFYSFLLVSTHFIFISTRFLFVSTRFLFVSNRFYSFLPISTRFITFHCLLITCTMSLISNNGCF